MENQTIEFKREFVANYKKMGGFSNPKRDILYWYWEWIRDNLGFISVPFMECKTEMGLVKNIVIETVNKWSKEI